MRLDTRLDARCFFLGIRLAAEVADVLAVLDNRLVAAAPKRHVNRLARKVVALRVAAAAVADADRERDAHLIADIHGLDLLQNIKLAV